jgi:hypothetical protein
MRAFIEGDIAASGPGNLFQLRHAYAQWRKLTVGQTWSTFSDPEAEPNGTVYVDNLDVQTGDAFHRTDRATLNLSWSPIPRIDIVSEFLLGRRINKDGQRGEARQLQLGTTFRF